MPPDGGQPVPCSGCGRSSSPPRASWTRSRSSARAGCCSCPLIVFAESGLLIGFFLPGDSLLFIAGFLTSDAGGNMLPALPIVLVCVFAAAVIGDQVGYCLRPEGRARRSSTGPTPASSGSEHLLKAEGFFARHGAKTIVLARFVPDRADVRADRGRRQHDALPDVRGLQPHRRLPVGRRRHDRRVLPGPDRHRQEQHRDRHRGHRARVDPPDGHRVRAPPPAQEGRRGGRRRWPSRTSSPPADRDATDRRAVRDSRPRTSPIAVRPGVSLRAAAPLPPAVRGEARARRRAVRVVAEAESHRLESEPRRLADPRAGTPHQCDRDAGASTSRRSRCSSTSAFTVPAWW